MEKIKRNIRGITLIALVITIIILLILAGIAISQLTENGLFENSKLAQEKYENAQGKEETQISEYTNYINSYVDSTRETVTIPKQEYDKLKKDASTVIITGTTPSNSNWGKVADYPQGYNENNTYVKSYIVTTTNNDLDTSYSEIGFQFRSDGIYGYATSSARQNRTIKIFLGIY